MCKSYEGVIGVISTEDCVNVLGCESIQVQVQCGEHLDLTKYPNLYKWMLRV